MTPQLNPVFRPLTPVEKVRNAQNALVLWYGDRACTVERVAEESGLSLSQVRESWVEGGP
jgi:hypothetical protein